MRWLPLLAALFAALLVAPSAQAVTGQFRVLYVLATWGPTPFAVADVERVAHETDAFFRASSSGRVSLPSAVAGWVRLERNRFNGCSATSLRAAMSSPMLAGYDRVAIITPVVSQCPFAGEADPTEVLLNGILTWPLAAHELGHTFGLGHASRWDCTGTRCAVDEYGSSFSVMGGGQGEFNAYEKSELGWLTGVARPRAAGTYEIGPIERPTSAPQAFVVTTARNEFWFESRGLPTPSFTGTSIQPAGVAVIAGPAPFSIGSPYPRHNLLLPNPSGGSRYAYLPGEAFTNGSIFRVTVERHAPEGAALRFEWLDRQPPARPRLRVRVTGRGRVRLDWEPAGERGSGVESYSLLVDGAVVRTVAPPAWTATLRATRGRHRVGVVATDRAGNRGVVASARVRVR